MPLRPINFDNHQGELYLNLLDSKNPRLRLYVYRVVHGKRVKPAMLKLHAPFHHQIGGFRYLEDLLRDKYDGGEFYLMFRRGEKMLLAGAILICPLPHHRGAFEAFKREYGW